MENEIAGKMLSCLRSSSISSKLNDTVSNLCSNTNTSNQNRNVGISLEENLVVGEEIFSFNLGYSFLHYLDRSIDRLPAIDMVSFEKYNYNALQTGKKTDSVGNLWKKFSVFLYEYLPSMIREDLLHELKDGVSNITSLNDEYDIEHATLIIFNLYIREKTSTGRKEELQRIFNLKDFKNIHRISNVINELLKSFSPCQLEDFTIRWDEVFKDRIEAFEKHFHSESCDSSDKGCSFDRSEVKHAVKLKCRNGSASEKKRLKLLNEIHYLEVLNNKEVALNVESSKQESNPEVTQLTINLSCEKLNHTPEKSLGKATLLCKTSSRVFSEEISRNEVVKILIVWLKKQLQEKANKSIKCKKKDAKKHMISVLCTQPCALTSDGDSGAEDNYKLRNNAVGKNWVEKQLRNLLNPVVFESINYKLIALFVIELLRWEHCDRDLEDKLVDTFGPYNFKLISTFMSKREKIRSQNTFLQKKINNVYYEKEVSKLKTLLREKTLQIVEKPILSHSAYRVSNDHLVPKLKKDENPHVFDCNLETKLSSAFVGGSKIMIPEHHIRKDTKTYEEIYIPIKMNVSHPLTFQQELISVSSLDEIGQTVFGGIENLNLIQSIVFPAAYHSNENLLICAPTGAGKTNVALLTVVHEIRQNIDVNVIKKDQFKIVYIAPMKALATEMTANFGKKLKPLGISVRELTGDMQLTKAEIAGTQMLISTPEKWDLVTRKGDGDTTLSSLVKLLIIDEVHLLHSDRGPVIEALVARTLRQVETSQKMIRLVGLSATLPNYKDVATFLRVNQQKGLFFFDSRFRPVPLSQCFVGVKARKAAQQNMEMNQVCYDKVLQTVRNDMQVMVFVHARMNTVRTATALREIATQKNHLVLFEPSAKNNRDSKKLFEKARAKQLHDLLPAGFAVHHAGLLRQDRSLVEECFSKGYVKVLVCTSTLAWGVNLPAHAVIIKGTEIYDLKHGSFMDLGILDVLQIFGRAGRPQFNECGDGVIITTHNKLHRYLALMMNQFPIESQFISYLADNLNAEITLGTITNIEEAIEWLSYTYLFVRMRINPQEYGINYTDVEEDYMLFHKRKELVEHTAKILDKLRMIRYNDEIGKLSPTDLGRTASLFYIKYVTIETFNGLLRDVMNEPETLNMLSQAHEFEQLKVRDEEMDELDLLQREFCEYAPTGGSENIHGKVNILLQTYLSRGHIKSFSLISDVGYIAQNASRIMRALFDIVLRQNNAILAGRFLTISQMFEHQQWYFETPLRQFPNLSEDILNKIDHREISIEQFKEIDSKEIGILLRNSKMGCLVKQCVEEFPTLILATVIQPITKSVLRIRLNVKAGFKWNDKVHGKSSEPFWVWVEDPESNFLYHSEYFYLTKKQVLKEEVQELVFIIPVHDPLPSQYVIRVSSDRWLGSISQISVPLNDIILPELHPVQTELLPLQPLPVTALQCSEYEQLYKFTHFNPIQTQIFHCLYHSDSNVLVGAPTGSGKTIVAEIAFFRAFKNNSQAKVVYIAPLKALVKERIRDWKIRFQKKLNKEVVELTGDVTPDIQAILSASIIVTTPEKWDSISRSWQTRHYVKKVVLLVIDEIHLLGEDRGPVLEVIVSRTNFISSHTGIPIRVIGLSTAVANAEDLANWLRIKEIGLYNFRPSVRPVPLEVHISSFPGKHYCPRMASMNKPAYQAIKQYSPIQPVLIFVSSRRQTRFTAMDLLGHLASENNPKQWLKLKDSRMDKVLNTVKDDNLKVVLAFGIGLHHAGLEEGDRKVVEELFEHQHIQVLIATSTLAWGVNFPAHLVIIKGTEYYDCKSHRYIDMPITDILQMMGRAGRPQFDKQGIAVVMVHDVKKNFYKRFLYEPFPVESNLLAVLPDHLNAEIVAGTVKTCQNAIDYLTWTYFFRRLLKNPVFYAHGRHLGPDNVDKYLTDIITAAVTTLEKSFLLTVDEDGRTLRATTMGRIASYYYISHQTMLHFQQSLKPDLSISDLVDVVSKAYEYREIPVRHNEELLNADLARYCKIKVDESTFDSPHTKTNLLIQAHFSRLVLPCSDYQTDLKMVLDNAIRIVQAMIDICGERGWLVSDLRAQQLMQMLVQGRWVTDDPLITLPNVEESHLHLFNKDFKRISLPALCKLVHKKYGELLNLLQSEFQECEINKIYEVLYNLPRIQVDLSITKSIGETNVDENVATGCVSTIHIDPKLPVLLEPNSEYVIHVKLTQHNKNKDPRVHAPKFPKPKDESWFLTVGDIESRELLALKRFTFGRKKEVFHNFVYQVPNTIEPTAVSIFLLSDSYIGLDQQYNIKIDVDKNDLNNR